MDTSNQLVKYKNNPIRKWFANISNKIKSKFATSNLWDKDIEDKISKEFPNELKQKEIKELLKDLLTRNKNLFETLDIRMLDKEFVDLFGKTKLERIITSEFLQRNILELSKEELQTYAYILNYDLVDFNERIGNLSTFSCKNLNLEELQSLGEKDRLKAISIILSNSEFSLNDLSELKDYYEKRKEICKLIIENPQIVEEEYEKNMNSEEISFFPFELLYEMQKLSDLDRTKYAICEAKYGMSLEKAEILCNAFGENIEEIKQSEDTRVIKELKNILKEKDIKELRQINLDENYANYEGTINIIPNLRNAYLHKYQKTLYQVNEEDYIDTQIVKAKGKKVDVKIYNVLGPNNDKADFNMIVTSLGGIYSNNHNYSDFKADWDRADKNHTISCSYIGNDFLGVVNENCLLAFSNIEENELLRASNQDAGAIDSPFEILEDLEGSRFLTPQNEKNCSKRYNELFVERKVEKEGKLVNRKPSFAVFIAETIDDIKNDKNERWQETKRMAAELEIPIAVIDGTQCTKLEFEKVQEMVKIVKEEKRMDLIPEIIHKIENNRAARGVILKDIRNEIFSEKKVKKLMEEVMGTIISSNISTFNQGIEEFVKVTKEIKNIYEQNDQSFEESKTYDYDNYLNRLKILFSSRNGLNGDSSTEEIRIKNELEKEDNKGISL